MTASPSPNSPALVIVVDIANVMGARADGWWRDRAGAALRLSREIAALAARGISPVQLPSAEQPPGSRRLPDGVLAPGEDAGPAPVFPWFVLVLEGRARDAAGHIDSPGPSMRIVRAPGSGDDTIVAESAAAVSGGARCLVVTADRELRERCRGAGASVSGPGWLLHLL